MLSSENNFSFKCLKWNFTSFDPWKKSPWRPCLWRQKALEWLSSSAVSILTQIMRLDGRVTKISERDLRVRKFQEDPSYDVFLLTTQVRCLRLSLQRSCGKDFRNGVV